MRGSFLFILSIILLFAACKMGKVDAPNVDDLAIEYDLIRTEQELLSLDTNNVASGLQLLKEDHYNFMDLYLKNVMGFYNEENPEEEVLNVKGFITDQNINLLYQAVQIQYGDFTDLEEEFTRAFQYYKYYFPERDIPDIYTFISEYGIQRFIFSDEEGKDALAIGLDLFLGADYPYHEFIPNNPAFSTYLIRRFNKDHLVKRVIGALVEDILGPNSGKNMLEKMIHNGKKIYILDQLLPYAQDSIIMEYTAEQLDWCENNELEMWAFFLKEDLFYESDINKINKLVNPSPNSPGMPSEAPGRTGNYIGWKIVEAYMKKQPEVTLIDLINTNDAQLILEESKYKPRN